VKLHGWADEFVEQWVVAGADAQRRAGVITALVDGSPASPGMRQLQSQLETLLTRGLRMRFETGVSVFVTVEDALTWSACDGPTGRQIGFRASIQSPASDSGTMQDVELIGHSVPATPQARAR
jgi:hypothetical protein